jgi:hypothetical protein
LVLPPDGHARVITEAEIVFARIGRQMDETFARKIAAKKARNDADRTSRDA